MLIQIVSFIAYDFVTFNVNYKTCLVALYPWCFYDTQMCLIQNDLFWLFKTRQCKNYPTNNTLAQSKRILSLSPHNLIKFSFFFVQVQMNFDLTAEKEHTLAN